jgi:hypothetical protein
MKILILYKYKDSMTYNHWGNLDFLFLLNRPPETSVQFYGYGITKANNPLALIDYSPYTNFKQLKQRYDFDILIFNSQVRMFSDTLEKVSWLPRDLESVNCPKILLEPDYHKHRKSPWILDNHITSIIHRHKNNVSRGQEDFPYLNHTWLPYSVDNCVFSPNFTQERKPLIGFSGNYKSNAYYLRHQALNLLSKNSLLHFGDTLYEQNYVNYLKQYMGYLNSSSIYNIDNTKMFEIMASGGVLFTNNCYNGIRELFPDNSYVFYKSDLSDLIKQATAIIYDEQLRNTIIKSALTTIQQKHTHKIRAKELNEILLNELSPSKELTITYTSKAISENRPIDIVYCIGNLTEDALIRMKCSYASLLENKINFNLCISEMGIKSHKDIIQQFLGAFKYHYQQSEKFNASVAKNNAFKYLIENNLFVFLDVDIIVPNNFISEILSSYEKEQRVFAIPYKRLPQTITNHYDYNLLLKTAKPIPITKGCGIIACDIPSYKLINGFDEDYTEWGARDSDFVYRLNLLHQIKQHPTLVVLHLFHVREFKNREKNMLRYKQRCEECKENFENIKKIRGVELLSETIPSSIQKNYNLLYLLTTLQNQNIRICLLKNSCYQATICGKLSEPLNIGISPVIELPSSDIKINILPFPNKTKFITIAGLKLEIPCPVTKYLENIYQKPWNQIKRGNI